MKKKNILQTVPCYLLLVVFVVFGCKSANKTPAEQADTADGFVSIFDGKTLGNWEGDPAYWRVENGCLTGEVTPTTLLDRNTFIIWKGGAPKDFELKLEFRISKDGNSGINYRSEPIDTIPFALKGYQCDIDGQNRYTGQNYEERKRTTLAYHGQKVIVNVQPNPELPGSLNSNIQRNAWQSVEITGSLGEPDSLNTYIHEEDWNTCHLVDEHRGYTKTYAINDILPKNSTTDGSIQVNLYNGLFTQANWDARATYNNVPVMTEINTALAGSLEIGFIDDQSELQYFQNPLSNVRIVVFGHTHKPMIKTYTNLSGKPCIYANSGTWEDQKTRDKNAAIDQDVLKMDFVTITPVKSNKKKLQVSLFQYKAGQHLLKDNQQVFREPGKRSLD